MLVQPKKNTASTVAAGTVKISINYYSTSLQTQERPPSVRWGPNEHTIFLSFLTLMSAIVGQMDSGLSKLTRQPTRNAETNTTIFKVLRIINLPEYFCRSYAQCFTN